MRTSGHNLPALIVIGFVLGTVSPFVTRGATIYYVDQNAVGSNNGQTWADAFKDLQSALAVAVSGDEIRVAQGTYTPSVNPQ